MSEPQVQGGTRSADYDDAYFRHQLGPPYTYEEPHWKEFFGTIADSVVAVLHPSTSYDAGCAKGLLVRALAERGVDARGGDVSEFAITEAPPGLAERLEVKDLTEPFTDRYDLITCIEVLEHMAPDQARTAIGHLCGATDRILLSSTPEDFGEPTHINVRPSAAWAQDFAAHGFYRRTDIDASFVSPWAVLLERAAPTPVEVVVGYETMIAPILREVLAKRQAVLQLQREIDDIGDEETTATRDAVLADEREKRLALADELIGVRAELAQNRVTVEHATAQANVEVVRLREVIAALEAELADARARADRAESRAALAEQAVLTRAEELTAEFRSATTWRIGSAVMAPTRAVRRWLGRGR
jgi:SAM-dependent methyltransferase